jgi:hypothetical protein
VALALVQSGGSSTYTNSGSSAQVLTANCTEGNTVILTIGIVASGDQVVSIVSGIGTFVLVGRTGATDTGNDAEIWICLSAAGAADTITVTTEANQWYAAAFEVSGNALTYLLVPPAGALNTTAPSLTASSLVSGNFVLVYLDGVGNAISAVPASPWVDFNGSGVINLSSGFDAVTQVVTTSSVTATWTAASGGWMTIGVILIAEGSPVVSGEEAFSYGGTVEVIQATVNPNAGATTVDVQYGPTNSYGSTSNSVMVPYGISPVVVQIPISGLTLGNTYHYRVVATNTAGTANGSDATFTTEAIPLETSGGMGYGPNGASGLGFHLETPNILSAEAFSYGGTIEVLQAAVDPSTAATVTFNWGTTNAYGNSVGPLPVPSNSASGSTSEIVTTTLTGLTLGDTYHFQCVATNGAGVIDGSDATFTTVGLPSYGGG